MTPSCGFGAVLYNLSFSYNYSYDIVTAIKYYPNKHSNMMTSLIYCFHVQQVNMWKNCSLLQKICPNHHLNQHGFNLHLLLWLQIITSNSIHFLKALDYRCSLTLLIFP